MTSSRHSHDALRAAAREIETFVASTGWDQTTRLFALVDTEALLSREPELAQQIAAHDELNVGALTPVEQDGVPVHTDPLELLASIEWPDGVDGAALALEMLMLPQDAAVPDDPLMAQQAAVHHPERKELRVVVAALRTGERTASVRWRDHDHADQVFEAPDLVETLGEALLRTFH
ncbi:MAG: PPA1309 family protein [Actinomycetes bacterium]